MTGALRLLPDLEEDARVGRDWYDERSPGLGDDFLAEFFEALDRIQVDPLLYRQIHGDVRRCLLWRFPYSVYFVIEVEDILVVGLFHCARDPIGIRDELGDRKR